MSKEVRVRFAPSPTGPLHIGGVRTALYNYLVARKNNGLFLLRIEDTDEMRYVEGAEAYILETLEWLGLTPDEGPAQGGDYGPYRQSERKHIYQDYVNRLIESGKAYYAFDSADELERMRERLKADGIHTPKYDHSLRGTMKNSLTLSKDEVKEFLNRGEDVVVRLLVPKGDEVSFTDVVRGEVTFDTKELDDKVLLKADGMPTYHLANVVDDYLMKISHVIRGEEWLSSTGHHVLLYRAFGWEESMPMFAHLPLILKPTGKGKLSKRDGAKFGFPVFPLDWMDEKENELFAGFRELGFLPEAVINFLAFLGWNPGTDEEMFSLEELTQRFDSSKIIKSGAKFNFDKARWYNQQYIIATPSDSLAKMIKEDIEHHKGETVAIDYLTGVCDLMKERVMTLNEFWSEGQYFFNEDFEYDQKMLSKKYKTDNSHHFDQIIEGLNNLSEWSATSIESFIKGYITNNELSFGAILPILRIGVSGVMKGPDLFGMMELFGRSRTIDRLTRVLNYCKSKFSESTT